MKEPTSYEGKNRIDLILTVKRAVAAAGKTLSLVSRHLWDHTPIWVGLWAAQGGQVGQPLRRFSKPTPAMWKGWQEAWADPEGEQTVEDIEKRMVRVAEAVMGWSRKKPFQERGTRDPLCHELWAWQAEMERSRQQWILDPGQGWEALRSQAESHQMSVTAGLTARGLRKEIRRINRRVDQRIQARVRQIERERIVRTVQELQESGLATPKRLLRGLKEQGNEVKCIREGGRIISDPQQVMEAETRFLAGQFAAVPTREGGGWEVPGGGSVDCDG